jgi:SAM-dependent methyltransferase
VPYLNVGCGTRFHPDWINVDLIPSAPQVIAHDLRRGLPFTDNTFDVVYHSHVLEHFPKNNVRHFMRECFRVLRPGGILRVVVPDLEGIVRQYLDALQQADTGHPSLEANYDWMMLELYDQTVRTFSGGEMGRALSRPEVRNNAFVRARLGAEVEAYETPRFEPVRWSWRNYFVPKNWPGMMRQRRLALMRLIVRTVDSEDMQIALDEALFRRSGETHQWMYDHFSLRRLMTQIGLADIRRCRADESGIPNFNTYQLDVIDGKVRKADSLFMEGRKL